MEPKEVTDLDLAFPANVIDSGLLPKQEDIPKEFWERNNEWNRAAFTLFLSGGHAEFKEEVDGERAVRHLLACLRSFGHKHEHKLAGVGWLLSQWMKNSEIKETK